MQNKPLTLVLTVIFAGIMLSTGARADDSKTIGIALASNVNPFYIAMRKGIEQRAEELGISISAASVDEDVVEQINGVQDLIAQGVDGILISPIDAIATRPAYAAAKEAGIPIMSIARHADTPDQTLFIAMDEVQIGRDIADWLIEAIGGDGDVALIAGPPGAATFQNLTKGFKERANESPDVSIVFESTGGMTRERGVNVAQDILVAHSGVKGIYAANDELALGAVQAVIAAGMQDQVVVTGMNGVPPAVAAVKRGELGMTVELNPVKWGRLGVDSMQAYFDGSPPEQRVFIQHKLIDSEAN